MGYTFEKRRSMRRSSIGRTCPDILSRDLTDAQCSTVAVIEDNGQLVERVAYDPYGKARHQQPLDLDGDGDAAPYDLNSIADAFGKAINVTGYNVDADIDRDGDVDYADAGEYSAKDALVQGQISDADNVVGWCGYIFSPETMDYIVRFRHYSPELGRWLERDPAGYVDGMNLYQNVRSSPTRFTDPQGLRPVDLGRKRKCIQEWREDMIGLVDPSLARQTARDVMALQRYCGNISTAVGASETFIEEISPKLDINLGFVEKIKREQFECCGDNGQITNCTKQGWRVLFGIKAEISAEWKVSVELKRCGNACPKEGQHFEMMLGAEADIKVVGAGGKAKLQYGVHLDPDGATTNLGSCGAHIGLPGGLGIGGDIEISNEGLPSLVVSVQEKLKQGVGIGIGSLSWWTIECEEPTGVCCEQDTEIQGGLK